MTEYLVSSRAADHLLNDPCSVPAEILFDAIDTEWSTAAWSYSFPASSSSMCPRGKLLEPK